MPYRFKGKPAGAKPTVPLSVIADMYAAGHSTLAIGKALGLASSGIGMRLRRAGIPRRSCNAYPRSPKTPTAEIVALYASGLSCRRIGQQIGISKHAVRDRLKRANVTMRTKAAYHTPSGPANHRWKGGRIVVQGYVLITTGPCQRQLEHRVVMERILGRRLKRSVYVHHINGIRHDNRPENLVVTEPRKHESRTLTKALQRRILYLESMLADAKQ